MLDILVESLGDPGTFDLTDKDNPMYYIARYSHEQSLNLYNLSVAEFRFIQHADSDFEAVEEGFDTYAGQIKDWFAAKDSKAELPAIPDITALLPFLGPAGWITFFIKLAIDIGMEWINNRIGLGEGSSGIEADLTELIAVLKQAFVGEIGESEFPLIELLANKSIEIILSRASDFQEILIGSKD